MLFNALAALGHRGIKTTATFGRAGLMLFNAVVGKPEFRKHAPLLVRQLYNVGVLSMLIIIVSGLFIGMVLGLQGYLVLTTYSAETSLGMLVALSLLRELGPVVAALLFAGRAGSALIKSLVFAITVTWIALFNGYDAIPTSAGISRATTRTVVHASLAVLGLDFVLTALMFGN